MKLELGKHMDPKSIANLDPKLRETYERVMGNTSTTPSASPASTDNQPAQLSSTPGGSELSATPPTPVAPPPDFSTPVSPEPQLSSTLSAPASPPSYGAPTQPAPAYSPVDNGLSAASQPSPIEPMQPLSSPAAVAATQGTSSVVKLLYIFGGFVFFVVYVFFWIKIFNYQLPF